MFVADTNATLIRTMLPVLNERGIIFRDGSLEDIIAIMRAISDIPDHQAEIFWQRVRGSPYVQACLAQFDPVSESDLKAYTHRLFASVASEAQLPAVDCDEDKVFASVGMLEGSARFGSDATTSYLRSGDVTAVVITLMTSVDDGGDGLVCSGSQSLCSLGGSMQCRLVIILTDVGVKIIYRRLLQGTTNIFEYYAYPSDHGESASFMDCRGDEGRAGRLKLLRVIFEVCLATTYRVASPRETPPSKRRRVAASPASPESDDRCEQPEEPRRASVVVCNYSVALMDGSLLNLVGEQENG
jgi:hypothetical protein